MTKDHNPGGLKQEKLTLPGPWGQRPGSRARRPAPPAGSGEGPSRCRQPGALQRPSACGRVRVPAVSASGVTRLSPPRALSSSSLVRTAVPGFSASRVIRMPPSHPRHSAETFLPQEAPLQGPGANTCARLPAAPVCPDTAHLPGPAPCPAGGQAPAGSPRAEEETEAERGKPHARAGTPPSLRSPARQPWHSGLPPAYGKRGALPHTPERAAGQDSARFPGQEEAPSGSAWGAHKAAPSQSLP